MLPTYNYAAGNATDVLTITNNEKDRLVIDWITFISATEIDLSTVSGDMMTTVPGTIIEKVATNLDGSIVYQISYPSDGEQCNCLTLLPGSSVSLTNITGNANNGLGLRMPPSAVYIHNFGTAPGEPEQIDIAGLCASGCDNPHAGFNGFGTIDDEAVSGGYDFEGLGQRTIDHPIYVGGLTFDIHGNMMASSPANIVNFLSFLQKYPYMQGSVMPIGDTTAVISDMVARDNFISAQINAAKILGLSILTIDITDVSIGNVPFYLLYLNDLRLAADKAGLKISASWPGEVDTINAIATRFPDFWPAAYDATDYVTAYPSTTPSNTSYLLAPLYAAPDTGTNFLWTVNATNEAYQRVLPDLHKFNQFIPAFAIKEPVASAANDGLNQSLTGSTVICDDRAFYEKNGTCRDGSPIPADLKFFNPSDDARANESVAAFAFSPQSLTFFGMHTSDSAAQLGDYAKGLNMSGVTFGDVYADAPHCSNESLADGVFGLPCGAPTPPPAGSATPLPAPSDHRLAIGLGAGLGGFGVLALAAGAYLWRRHRAGQTPDAYTRLNAHAGAGRAGTHFSEAP